MGTRQKDTEKTYGQHKATDIAFNEQSGGLKVVGPILGRLIRLTTATGAAQDLPEPARSGAVIAFYNPTAAALWLTISTTAADPEVPAVGEANSIALKPNDYTILAMPEGTTKIRATSGAIVYLVEDSSTIR